MQIITKQELKDNLMNMKGGANIVSIVTKTTPRMRKTDNPFYDKVEKVSKVNGIINWRYSNAVNNQRKREGKEDDFQAVERRWGQRIKGTPLVEHKGKYYLEMKVERKLNSEYIHKEKGEKLDMEQLGAFLYTNSSSKRQNLEKEVVLRDYKLDSIDTIKMNGEEYKVV